MQVFKYIYWSILILVLSSDDFAKIYNKIG